MAATSDQIQEHIQKTKLDLNENINELQQKVKSTMDWRAQFEEHPLTMMGLALGAGVVLSVLLPARRRRSASARDGDVARYASSPYSRAYSRPGRTRETWDALKGALAGVATSRLSEYLDGVVPGFKQEFSRARSGRASDNRGMSDPDTSTWRESSSIGGD